MIILRSERGEVYNLFYRKKHVVGRNGNLELEEDKSVSRQHAVIHVTVKDKKVEISLQDLGSKYGTFVNDGIRSSREIPKNTPTQLKVGDKVRFGLQWNTWTVEESKLVVCTSTLTQSQKGLLKSLVTSMKGVLVSNWTDSCTHLTMNEIKITVKVVCALGSVKPIVSIEYWRTLAEVMNSDQPESLPDCDDYVPPLAEPSLMNVPTNFCMSNVRKSLFRGVKFITCTSSQYNSILPMVKNAGGTVLNGTTTAITEEQFLKEKYILLSGPTMNKRNRCLAQSLKILEKNKHRCIAESEIGLSLIFCSKETYCNPKYDMDFVLSQPESQVTIKDEESILDLETQDLGDENSTQFIDSDSSKFSLAVKGKIIISDSDEEQVIPETQPRTSEVEKPPAKRKLNDSAEKPNLKTSKLDSWLISKTPAVRNSSSFESASQSTSKSKKSKSIFAFPRGPQTTEKSSESLFKNISNNADNSTENKRKRAFVDLSSSAEISSQPSKKPNLEKKNLFQWPSTSKEPKSETSLVLFDSNDSMDSLPDRAAKMTIANKPGKVDSSTVMRNSVSLSQFTDRSNKREVKEEPADMTTEVKGVLNKTIVHTLSLVKNEKSAIQLANNGHVNFKKFRKNNSVQRSHVISIDNLFLFESKSKVVGNLGVDDIPDSSS